MGPLWMWHKYEPIIKEQRVRYKMPLLLVWMEYLAGEIERYYEERGYTDIIPENLGSYVPDE